MAFSKITLNGVTLMDVTQDTVTAANLLDGFIATAADGSRYEGTIATKTESDLTASGSKVTVPSGYYAAAASKAVAAGTATTPATSITTTPTITVSSTGLITATVSSSKSITPTVSAGYISSGTAGTVTASGSNTSQLSTQAAATISPTESVQTAVASGKYTTGVVSVGAISSNYVGSNIPQNDSSDLTASGSKVTVPSGYYAATASKAIAAGSATTPATTITANPGITISASGLITATVNSSKSITPTISAGYISAGTAGTVTASGSNTSQLTIQTAQIITPTTSDQTIASNLYLTGIQTILGDANLIPANIAKNISIFGVLGTFEGGSSIEMESGTFKPSSDIAHPTISFSNTHTTPPSFAWIAYNGFVNTSSMMVFVLFDPVALFGFPMYYNSTSTRKGAYFMGYRGTGTAASFSSGIITYGTDNSGSSDTTYYRYYATESQFKPYSGSGQRYFRAANTFSWKAYWL